MGGSSGGSGWPAGDAVGVLCDGPADGLEVAETLAGRGGRAVALEVVVTAQVLVGHAAGQHVEGGDQDRTMPNSVTPSASSQVPRRQKIHSERAERTGLTPPGAGTRTQATTVSLCTSNPAQRSTTTSIEASYRSSSKTGPEPRDVNSGVRALGNNPGCSKLLRHIQTRARGTNRTRRHPPAGHLLFPAPGLPARARTDYSEEH